MSKRSVSQRNFAGAFLGGVLGVLATHYLHPIALILGCFVGMSIGWCYEEIWESVRASVGESAARTRSAAATFKAFWVSVGGDVIVWFVTPFKIAAIVLRLLRSCFVRAIVWLARRPQAIMHWIRADEWHQILTLRSTTAAIFIGINSLWVIPLVKYCFTTAFRATPKEELGVYMLLPGILVPAFLVLLPLSMVWGFGNKETAPGTCRSLESYRVHGAFGLLFREFYNAFLIQIFCALVISGLLFWLIGLGGALLMLVIIPISVSVGLARGLRKASGSAGYWFCFGVTVTVTALVAWLAYPYFGDARVLWLSAMFAGLASAGAVEAGRRQLAELFEGQPRLREFVEQSLEKRIEAYGNWFVGTGDWLGERFCRVFPEPL